MFSRVHTTWALMHMHITWNTQQRTHARAQVADEDLEALLADRLEKLTTPMAAVAAEKLAADPAPPAEVYAFPCAR